MSKPAPIFPVVAPSARTAEENVALLGPLAHVVEVKGTYALVHASPVGVARIAQELGLEVFPSKRGGEYYAVKVAAKGLTLVPSVRPVQPLVLTSPTARPVSGGPVTLEIRGSSYRVIENAPKRRCDVRRFEVRRLGDELAKPYVVSFQDVEAHSLACSCPDAIYRKTFCKHQQAVKAHFVTNVRQVGLAG